MDKIKILAVSGSLRKNSFNTSALRAAKTMLAEDVEMEIFDISSIPLFNADFENAPPESIVKFKAAIRAADAILVSSPEYNYSVSGVLKNAIDAATRPHGDNPFSSKPGAIMGVSSGRFGTARGFYDLAKIMRGVNVFLMNYPEILITEGAKKFDENGNLVDEETAKKMHTFVSALADWTRKLKAAGIAK
jgi:chromate reductase